MPILLGQEALLDKRCLWVYLSIPLRNSSPEEAYKTLEQAWFSWYQWWQPRFPKS
jgi:cyanosortase A-associated protein